MIVPPHALAYSYARKLLGAKRVTSIMALSLGVGGLGVTPPSSNSSCSCSRVRSSSAVSGAKGKDSFKGSSSWVGHNGIVEISLGRGSQTKGTSTFTPVGS